MTSAAPMGRRGQNDMCAPPSLPRIAFVSRMSLSHCMQPEGINRCARSCLSFQQSANHSQQSAAGLETVRSGLLETALAGLLSTFPWPERRPFSELTVEAEAVRAVAAECQATRDDSVGN